MSHPCDDLPADATPPFAAARAEGPAPTRPAELRELCLQLLQRDDAAEKARAVRRIDLSMPVDPLRCIEPAGTLPGRPARPGLVPPSALKSRSVHTVEGRAALLHALAHIEFNAINLALDIVWRFASMPPAFYRQWAGVAREEALHFELLRRHLQRLGRDYGDLPAHDGLWEMANRTREDLLARLALVPRTLEARGLDASPAIRARLLAAGDREGARLLSVILRDEIGHVAVGDRWYRQLCHQHGLDPDTAWLELARAHAAPRPRGPFNLAARHAAGFEPAELDALQAASATR